MAGNSYEVTINTLTQQCEDLSELNSRLNNLITKLETSEGNLNTMWDGEANNAFHSAFMTDKGKMVEFYKLINKYIQNLSTIASRYSAAESANTEIARNRTY